MLFKNKDGRILTMNDLNKLEPWEVDEQGIRTHEKEYSNSTDEYLDYTEFS